MAETQGENRPGRESVIRPEDGEACGHEGLSREREHHHDPARSSVGDDTCHWVQEEAGDENGERRCAHPSVGVGELEHQDRHGQLLHPLSRIGDESSRPEEGEVSVAENAPLGCGCGGCHLGFKLIAEGLKGVKCWTSQ